MIILTPLSVASIGWLAHLALEVVPPIILLAVGHKVNPRIEIGAEELLVRLLAQILCNIVCLDALVARRLLILLDFHSLQEIFARGDMLRNITSRESHSQHYAVEYVTQSSHFVLVLALQKIVVESNLVLKFVQLLVGKLAILGTHLALRYVGGVTNQLCVQTALLVADATHCATSVLYLDNLAIVTTSIQCHCCSTRGHRSTARSGYACATLVGGYEDAVFAKHLHKRYIYSLRELLLQLQNTLAKMGEVVVVNLLDLRHDVRVTHIYCTPEQMLVESLDSLRNELLLALGKAEVGACKANSQIYAVGWHRRVDILGTHNAIDISAREHIELTHSDILLGQASHATNAVATHLRLRAVGVEHSHSEHLVLLDQKQHAIGAERVLSVADETGEIGEVDAVEVVLHRIHHNELIARAVTLYVVKFHSIWSIIVQK